MSTPTYPHFVGNNDIYIDYEISHELPSFDDPASDSVFNEHSIVIRLSYDTETEAAHGLVQYEQNGTYNDLGSLTLTNEQFYRITGCPLRPENKLAALRNVKGNVTIENGIATLPNGSQITL